MEAGLGKIIANVVCLNTRIIPLIIALYSIRAEKWRSWKGSEYVCLFLLFNKEAPFCKSCKSLWYYWVCLLLVSFFFFFWMWAVLVFALRMRKEKQVDFKGKPNSGKSFLCMFQFSLCSTQLRDKTYSALFLSEISLFETPVVALHKSFCCYLCYIPSACLGMPCS